MKKRILIAALCLLTLCAMLFSCGSDSSSSYPNNGGSASKGDGGAYTTSSESRKIVTTVSVSLNTADFNRTTADIEAAVAAVGGRITYSNVSPHGEDSDGYASYSVLIPTPQIKSFSDALAAAGEVTERRTNEQDVTEEYVELESRIATLQEEKARVATLYDEAASTTDKLAVEARLSEITAELNQLTRRRDALQTEVDYTVFSISVCDTAGEVKANFFVRFGRAFVNAFKVFADVVGYLLIGLVYLLPFVLAGGVLFLILFFVIRHNRKKKQK